MGTRRAKLAFWLVVGTGWFVTPAVPASSAQSLTLTATAGLDGVTKAGRWTPVRVLIDNRGAERSAAVAVTWGDHTLTRAVSMTAASRRQFEVMVRTGEVQDRIRVELQAGTDTKGIDVPVRVMGYDEPLSVCVGTVHGDARSGACTVTLAADRAPGSPRGYDAADTVAVADDGVPAATRVAIAQWRALREIDVSGDLSATRRLTRPLVSRGLPDGSRLAVLLLGTTCVVGLVTIALLQRRRPAPVWTLAATLVLLCAATAAAWRLVGRVGPGSAVTVRHTSMVQQLNGVPAALVTSRAVVFFPAWRPFRLRALPLDGALVRESETDPDRTEQRLDEDGTPVLEGEFGLAARRTVEFEAMADLQLLDVRREGARATVQNVSNVTLEDCRFADGFSPDRVWQLAPGETADASATARGSGPIFSCSMPGSPVTMTESGGDVVMDGTTLVMAYDRRAAATADTPVEESR